MAKTYRGVATSGLNAKLPRLEIWASQFPQPTITIVDPEYNATCPKTGLADFGTVTIRYEPAARCIELKSFKPGVEQPPVVPSPLLAAGKAGRNEPCPFGSGRKFKKCCGA